MNVSIESGSVIGVKIPVKKSFLTTKGETMDTARSVVLIAFSITLVAIGYMYHVHQEHKKRRKKKCKE